MLSNLRRWAWLLLPGAVAVSVTVSALTGAAATSGPSHAPVASERTVTTSAETLEQLLWHRWPTSPFDFPHCLRERIEHQNRHAAGHWCLSEGHLREPAIDRVGPIGSRGAPPIPHASG